MPAEGAGHPPPRAGPVTIPLEPDALEAAEPDESDDPARAFDRQWAATILDMATRRVEADCRRRGLDVHWAIYEARIMRPACAECQPVPADALAKEHGIGEAEVYSRLNTVKRKIRNALESTVLETLEDPSDLEHELAELRRVLSVAGP